MRKIKYSGIAVAVLGGITLLNYYAYMYAAKYNLPMSNYLI